MGIRSVLFWWYTWNVQCTYQVLISQLSRFSYVWVKAKQVSFCSTWLIANKKMDSSASANVNQSGPRRKPQHLGGCVRTEKKLKVTLRWLLFFFFFLLIMFSERIWYDSDLCSLNILLCFVNTKSIFNEKILKSS